MVAQIFYEMFLKYFSFDITSIIIESIYKFLRINCVHKIIIFYFLLCDDEYFNSMYFHLI